MGNNIKIQTWVLLGGIVLLGGKFVAYFLTGSNLVLTDALESIVNVVAGGLGLYSLILSSKPKDENHPYGHGKIEFITAAVEGILICLAGAGIIFQSVKSFFTEQPLQHLETGIIIVAVAGLVNFLMGWGLVKRGKKSRSPVLKAGGEHLKSDAYSSLAMLVGLGLVYFTGVREIDYIAAALFGAFIIYTGIRVLRSSIGGIMDETDYKLVAEIVALLEKYRKPAWIDFHNMRVIKYGTTYHIDCHITLPYYLTIEQAHDEINEVEKLINDHFDTSVEVFIHSDPCIETSCSICVLEDCLVRRRPFRRKEHWDTSNVMLNRKHGTYHQQTPEP